MTKNVDNVDTRMLMAGMYGRIHGRLYLKKSAKFRKVVDDMSKVLVDANNYDNTARLKACRVLADALFPKE